MLGALLGVFLIILMLIHEKHSREPWEGFQKPDDVQTARGLLAARFTGTTYFQFVEESGTDRQAPPYISPAEARRQLPDIARARGFSPEQIEIVNKLVDILVDPPSSRVFGSRRVNTLQLNLALDSMK